MSKRKSDSTREVVKKQILDIRNSGLTNMLDRNAVQRIANERDYFELVCFIEDYPDRYAKFIISGDTNLLPK